MRALMALTILLFINISVAEVFKCEAPDGKISYQESECLKSNVQKKLEIQKIDPEITRKALETLNKTIEASKKAKEEKRIALEKAQEKERQQPNPSEADIEDPKQNNRDRNYYPGYPFYYKKNKFTNPKLPGRNRNQRNSFNPPAATSRQSSMNPPSRR